MSFFLYHKCARVHHLPFNYWFLGLNSVLLNHFGKVLQCHDQSQLHLKIMIDLPAISRPGLKPCWLCRFNPSVVVIMILKQFFITFFAIIFSPFLLEFYHNRYSPHHWRCHLSKLLFWQYQEIEGQSFRWGCTGNLNS